MKAAQAAHRRVQTRAVDSEAVRHFIEQTDLDYLEMARSTRMTLRFFARKMAVRPPPEESWEQQCEFDGQECLRRTGYGNKGMPNTAPPVISAADIVAACRTRTDPCSKRSHGETVSGRLDCAGERLLIMVEYFYHQAVRTSATRRRC